MKKGVIILSISLLVVVIILIIVWPDNNPVPEGVRCKVDSDCELINICCSCDEGGTRGAIAKIYKQEFLEIININCQDENSLSCNGTSLGFPNCDEGVYARCWNGWCSTSNQDPWSMTIEPI